MAKVGASEWRKLPISLTELCINTTLRCGQSFRWKKNTNDEWTCALHGRILSLRQDATHLHYRATFPSPPTTTATLTPPPSSPSSTTSHNTATSTDDTEALVRHYLNLEPNLTALYAQWSRADANFQKKAPKFTGVRILRQDAWEALIGFICSSNNNISRIGQMVDKLCRYYGPLIGHIGADAYYDFPSPQALTSPNVEQHLRQLGFGYRARYIWQTAVIVAEEKGIDWLDGLRNPEKPVLGKPAGFAGEMKDGGREGYRRAHEELLALSGVGPKVADCVCLMGLGWGEAVPVDTHVWQIAVRDYKFGKGKHSSLTKATYDAIGDKFRSLWGQEAGWAHSVLFTADLRAFAERLVVEKAVKIEATDEDGVEKKITELVMTPGRKRVKREFMDEEKAVVKDGLITPRSERAKRRRWE